MSAFDLAPLFRSSVGFDRMMKMLETRALDEGSSSYPPYNIVKKNEETYRITMAVAGFREEDLQVVTHEGLLSITGLTRPDPESWVYLHRGIAGRAFERRFQLADHIRVLGASLEDGLLHIELNWEIPESLKPRKIKIQSKKNGPELLDHVGPISF